MAKKEKQTGTSLTTGEGGRSALMRPELGFGASPFAMMQRLMGDMDRVFEDFGIGGPMLFPQHLALPDIRRGTTFEFTWWPQVDVVESQGKLVVRADLPGLKKEDLKINVEDDCLILEGERKIEKEETEGGIYRAERSYGKFRRVIALPEGANPESAKAEFTDGVLEVSVEVPARESRSRRIEIGVGAKEKAAPEKKPAEQPEAQIH